MKKSYKKLIRLSIAVILVFIIYSYFHVSGKEIYGASQITENSEVTIQKRYLNVDGNEEYTLDGEQIVKLKELILKSDFKRNLSDIVFFDDRDLYTIIINNKDEEDWLIIDCIGNEYISITNQFNEMHLKIKNPKWKETLEEIISKNEKQ